MCCCEAKLWKIHELGNPNLKFEAASSNYTFTTMIRIALAYDHQLVLDGLKSMIDQNEGFKVVAEANNGKQLLDLVSAVQVDVVLVDIDMPVMNGLMAITEMKKQNESARIIALTMHNEKSMIERVIAAGASGYLLKNIDQADLLHAITKVADGGKCFSDDVTLTLAGGSNTRTSQSLNYQNSTLENQLSEREVEILKLIAEGFSNKEVGEKLFISHRTVDTHRTNLMKKLEVHNIAGLIRYAIQAGYID